MPEPLGIASAAIGTTLGILGLLASTLSGLNARKRSIIDFSPRLRVLITTLEGCQGDLTEWDAVWNWEEYSEYVYRRLWDDKFERINQQRTDVRVNADNLNEYVRGLFNIDQDAPEETWTNIISRLGGFRLFLTRFRFAFFSEQTLRDKIDLLERDIKNLKALCDERFRILERAIPAPRMRKQAAGRFVTLGEFGQKVWDLRSLKNYSGWALELWPSGHSRSVRLSDWQTMTEVQISIAFRHNQMGENHAQDHSVILKYALEKKPRPDNWADGLANTVQDGNPKIYQGEDAHHEMTATFRNLFIERRQFFDNLSLTKTWEGDLSNLLLSLAHWSALLWYTNWTTNLCSSGIRYVRRQDEKPSLHTLGLGQDHEPGPQQDEEDNDLETCSHGGPELKLKNLGLVIAELICATPFQFQRADTSRYERWDHDTATWRGTTQACILDDVGAKSRSQGVREAVYFCLTSNEGRSVSDGLGAFLHYYEAEVINPLKHWRAVIHDPANLASLNDVQGMLQGPVWPHVAFEEGHDIHHNAPLTPEPNIPGAWPGADAGL